jgi:hypothetical protein
LGLKGGRRAGGANKMRCANPYRTPPTFRFAYQAGDNRPIMEALDAVLTAKAPELAV